MTASQSRVLRLLPLVLALFLAACASASAPAARGPAMAAAADSRAVEAGLEMLRAGGDATDAAIAAMAVLGLVEPQSAGIGGGGFLLRYDGASEAIDAFDGRERAPMGARPDMFLGPDGAPLPFRQAQVSGLSIGTPALIAMLKLTHEKHGRLPWASLFAPAIRLAEDGFLVSPRLNGLISHPYVRAGLTQDPAAAAYFYDEAGAPRPVGFRLRNPAYAATLRAIAAQGPRALTHGPIAEEIVAVAQRGPRAGTLSLADLQAYRPRQLEPICGAFRAYRVCGMPSPSSGGTAVLAILGLYERARPQGAAHDAGSVEDWAAFLWASRLSYADRDHYFADDEYAPVPSREMIAPGYLDQRAALIDVARAPNGIAAGAPAGDALRARWGSEVDADAPGTTHISIVDARGNAVALTATIEAGFGANRMAAGFLLNNELTDFSFLPVIDGKPVANAVAPGKRPRSSMAPTIITDADGELEMVIGSPGGSGIIGYVARVIIGVLDWDQSVQEAIDTGNVVARRAPAVIETPRLPQGLPDALRARGWNIRETDAEVSGLHGIRITPEGLQGGADPRREGVVGALD